jgi:hypothetical protein
VAAEASPADRLADALLATGDLAPDPARDGATAGALPGESRAVTAAGPQRFDPAFPNLAGQAHRPVALQLAEAVASGSPVGDGSTIDITLSPDELGQVRLSLHHGDRGLTVQVQTERPETADLIRRHLPDLYRDLRDLGHGSVEFSFGERPRQTRDHAHPPAPGRDEAATRSALSAVPAQPVQRAASGLDIRL